jgi:hypothetical protein
LIKNVRTKKITPMKVNFLWFNNNHGIVN